MSVLTEKLKSCPFCGSRFINKEFRNRPDYVRITCGECGANVGVKVSYAYCAKDEVIKAWNRRAGDEE